MRESKAPEVMSLSSEFGMELVTEGMIGVDLVSNPKKNWCYGPVDQVN